MTLSCHISSVLYTLGLLMRKINSYLLKPLIIGLFLANKYIPIDAISHLFNNPSFYTNLACYLYHILTSYIQLSMFLETLVSLM